MINEIKEIIRLNCEEEIDVKYFAKDNSLVDTTMDYSQLLDYITNLQEKYEKSLELLADFNMPCEYDENKISHNYCEEFCDTDDETYKKCWNKYIENILRGDE